MGFTGKPNKGESPHKHNEFGFLGPELNQAKSDDFTIAFFGGSTGYRGNPNLPIMIEENLIKNNFNKGNVFISNFSAESSNHNQHLHMLIEFVLTSKVDLVIFYGGWNETVAQAAYDPRPGYPINFFYIHDEPHWKKFLIENSKIFGSLQHKIVSIRAFVCNTNIASVREVARKKFGQQDHHHRRKDLEGQPELHVIHEAVATLLYDSFKANKHTQTITHENKHKIT